MFISLFSMGKQDSKMNQLASKTTLALNTSHIGEEINMEGRKEGRELEDWENLRASG